MVDVNTLKPGDKLKTTMDFYSAGGVIPTGTEVEFASDTGVHIANVPIICIWLSSGHQINVPAISLEQLTPIDGTLAASSPPACTCDFSKGQWSCRCERMAWERAHASKV